MGEVAHSLVGEGEGDVVSAAAAVLLLVVEGMEMGGRLVVVRLSR